MIDMKLVRGPAPRKLGQIVPISLAVALIAGVYFRISAGICFGLGAAALLTSVTNFVTDNHIRMETDSRGFLLIGGLICGQMVLFLLLMPILGGVPVLLLSCLLTPFVLLLRVLWLRELGDGYVLVVGNT